MNILERIRQRSDNQKKIFSLVTAVVLTFVIVVVWFSFTNNSANNQITRGEKMDKLSSISPWQMVKDEFSKAFSGLKDNVQDDSSISIIPIEIVNEEAASSSLTTSTEIVSTSSVSTSTGIRKID